MSRPAKRFPLQQDGDVFSIDLQAYGRLYCHRIRLVRRLVDHGRESEQAAVVWIVDQDLLLVFIHRCHAHAPGHQDVGAARGFPYLEDALTRGKLSYLNLAGQYSQLLLVQQFESGTCLSSSRSQGIGVLSFLHSPHNVCEQDTNESTLMCVECNDPLPRNIAEEQITNDEDAAVGDQGCGNFPARIRCPYITAGASIPRYPSALTISRRATAAVPSRRVRFASFVSFNTWCR